MPIKKIYINARYLTQRPTGVERYAYEMCRALRDEGADITLICPKHGEINEAYDISGFNIVRYGIGSSHFWEQIVLPTFFFCKRNYLVVSFTGLGSIFVPHKLMTIHDLSFLENKAWFSKAYYWYYKIMTPLAVKTSKGIITVSEFSKKEILRFYRFLSADKIAVIYNAADSKKFGKKCMDKQNYFLAVSSLDPRKNFSRLLQAFKDIDGYKLKIVGGSHRVFGSSGIESTNDNVEFMGRVSDSELARLYSEAAAFIFPSLYEGFGLPPIEAMTAGCPVIVSGIPVLREVCGDAALYFDPNDIESIQSAIHEVINLSCEQRQKMILSGFANVKRFSWKQSAQQLIQYFNNLCNCANSFL